MTFQLPQMLFALALAPLLLVLYSLAQRRRKSYAVRFTNLALLQDVIGRGPGIRRHIPPMLYLLGVAAMLFSLARPEAVMAVPREQAAVMLAMDISGSMGATDMQPNRMEAAKQAAQAFVAGLPDDIQVGLVSFSEKAYVNVPLTRDHQLLERGISQLRADGSTAIGEALFQSLDQLALREVSGDDRPSPALVVLLSDGESNEGRPPSAGASRASADGIPVYTVGIGQRNQSTTIAGGHTVGLDEKTLQAVAEITSGQYFYAAETEELTQIYTHLSSLIAWVNEHTEISAYVAGLGTLFFLIGGFLSLRWFQQFP